MTAWDQSRSRTPGEGSSHDGKKRVLFICTYNSVRSQMAEGILRHLYGDRYEVESAGIAPAGVSRHAVLVLQEAGIDISTQHSKSYKDLPLRPYDIVVTICDEAGCVAGALPPAGRVVHHPFPSPTEIESGADVLEGFRALRDQIREWLQEEFCP